MSERNYIWRVKIIIFVIYIELMNLVLISMCGNIIIWYMDCYLYSIFYIGIFIDYF